MTVQRRRLGLAPARKASGTVNPGPILRRRRSPLQLALGGVLVVLILGVEVLILQAYANVNRSTAIFGKVTFLAGALVNVEREALLLNVEVEELPTTLDLRGTQVRRALLGNQLHLADGLGDNDPMVKETLRGVDEDLRVVDQALARAKAKPTEANLRNQVRTMRPAIRDVIVSIKQLYDTKEQEFFGALSGTLRARTSSERLLVGLSGLVLVVGLALALSLRQRVRKDFARAYEALTAEVDERKAAEQALRASEERFRSLVQNSSDVISIVDADGGVRYHSESVRRVLGYDPRDLVDGDPLALVHPDDRERVARFVAEAALRPGVTPAETWRVRHRDGTWLHSETVAANLLEDPNVRGLVLNTRDVSDRKELEEQLVHQAFHDGLTGLANRTLFAERVEHALARSGPGDLAVMFIDLDDFKNVNDSLGHAAGDQLLVAAARRLQGCLRPTDTAARLGGDEFAVLLERVSDAEAAGVVAGRILDMLHKPFGLNGRTIPIKASLGVAVVQPGVVDVDELLRNADVAMYAAKAGGKDRFELFRPDMHADMLQRLELEAELRHATDRGELVLHYQPIVELVSGRITRVEALVRWNHPTRGLLPPPAFIPLAEEQGMIGPIGRWVLLEACQQARRWQDRFPDAPPLAVHVNLSGRQLEEQSLVGEVVQALETSRLVPRLLTLEITETVLMTDIETMSQRLRELKGLGVLLAIDDFGTGYSSLSYLRRFPIDMLKIDKAFVDGIGRGREDTALAHAIINLSHTLQLHTVAEGIERPEQAAHLAALGCQDGQGYHFARPLTPAAMSELLEQTLVDGGFHLPVVVPAVEPAAAT
ncbi:MAG TPA: EAL domain-containing protein [Actinomycetes bacterium]|jgi:diguanylate cyclase (GGDEF)-like protein/PAS domain S-box-containing protein|nr:EAL domain-containing protein [Actinomycetes bacterium]